MPDSTLELMKVNDANGTSLVNHLFSAFYRYSHFAVHASSVQDPQDYWRNLATPCKSLISKE